MITNSQEANQYYQVINQYIDEYTDKHKIKPSNLGKYLKNNNRLIKFMEKRGLKDIKNVDVVIKDVIDDRIAMEKDSIKTFESFKMFESTEYKLLNLRQCLYKGIEKSTIHHEKILADYWDVSLSHVDIINSDKHIFKIEGVTGDRECVIYTDNEVEIIRENMKEYCFNEVFGSKIKVEGILDLDVNIKDFIDNEKFENHISEILTTKKVKSIIRWILSCDKEGDYNPDEGDNFIGIDPSNY